ncbi:MAG: hypothetical protein JW730_02385 [Anaerolineales bacterium]|nr:hypothetical protein [Anaerolineales bacterium]
MEDLLNEKLLFRISLCPLVPFVVGFRQNKSPFAVALGDWFPLRTYFLTSKASPNDSKIVIIVIIIIIGEAKFDLHIGGIIAQTSCLSRGFFGTIKTPAVQLKIPYRIHLLKRRQAEVEAAR